VPIRDPSELDETLSVDWVVKASKLCNLRCRYCYEWESLGDAQRLTLAQWERIFAAAAEFARLKAARNPGCEIETRIIWHGGEPLLLGAEYIDSVIALQRRIFGNQPEVSGTVRNLLQTNFYRVEPEIMDCLARNNVSVGISIDFVAGARLNAAGETTERRVRDNMRRYRGHESLQGLIVVLAGHTARHLEAIYRFARRREMTLRVLPLFDGPESRPMNGLGLSGDEAVDALFGLFRLWLDDGCPMKVMPLDSLLKAAMLHKLAMEQPSYDRRRDLDSIFLVDIDGALYQPGDPYGQDTRLGNVLTETMEEILAQPAYTNSLTRNDALVRRSCALCDFDGACDRYPVLADRASSDGDRRCGIARPLLQRIDRYLDQIGFDAETFSEWFDQSLR
jgi:uncharacterized protein